MDDFISSLGAEEPGRKREGEKGERAKMRTATCGDTICEDAVCFTTMCASNDSFVVSCKDFVANNGFGDLKALHYNDEEHLCGPQLTIACPAICGCKQFRGVSKTDQVTAPLCPVSCGLDIQ